MTGIPKLDQVLVRLAELSPSKRTRTNVTQLLQQFAKEGLVTHEVLQQLGLVRPVIVDSYGRGIVSVSPVMPDSAEILVVTVPAGFAPAIHDHGTNSAGANLLGVSGSFYNVNYKYTDNPVGGGKRLTHQGIQFINQGDVAFIPGGHGGMHRVVNTGK